MTTQNICNICGANYEYRDGKWRCPACGAYRPEEVSGEEETLLYNAAQKLRLSAFDDAEELYRDIVSQYPKNSRGYWGLVLAKYGIKYEKDYDGKMVPSCYAASYESIFGDENYKKALQYADKDNRAYYEAQAKRIDVIRREWVEKAEREEPYDIFLSYKDSDKENNIERTDDSRDAYELYSKLKEKGYRVFYSRESLAGKEGEKFEPYIFNALNTAQVMIVYGTKPEYIESTWVKNEWMRYYKRIERGEKQKNSLILAYKGLNPSKLPKPLCDIQGIDLGRITVGFGDLETRVANILSAARMSQKIARVSVKGRERRAAEHIRRLNTVKVGKVVSEEPKSERARIATRTIGGKSVKLSVNAEKSLSVAESYLARGQFTEAEERFDEILLSSPRNGRALIGKLLAQSNVQDLPGLEKNGFRVFPDVPLIESVLSNAEKSSAESVLRVLCAEASRSFDRGDIAQAKLIVSVVREYAGSAVDKLRGDLYERGLNLVATDEESAKYFLDIHLSFEEDEEEYIKKLHTIVNSGIEHSAFTFAGYYADKLKEEDANNYETQLSLLKIEYKTKDEAEVFRCIDREKAYQQFEDVLSELEPKSAARWLRACFSEIAELLQKGVYAGALRWIEICAKYQFAGRKELLGSLLSICINSASMRSSECFDAILTYVADGDASVYAGKAKTFADTALKAKEFDAAKLYYGKILSVKPDCVVAAQGKFFADIRCANEKELPFALVNLTDWSCFEEVLIVQTDDADDLKWIEKIASACIEHIRKAGTAANAAIFGVFEKLLSYIPNTSDDVLLSLLRQAADLCLQEGLFAQAQKYYEMFISENAEDSSAYWGLLQAKLKCRNDDELVRQTQPISTFNEFENAQVCAADDKAVLNHYIDVRDKQIKNIKSAKKRKRIIKIGSVVLSAAVVIGGGLGGWFAYYNSQSGFIYAETNGGYAISAGRFYKADERLVIPDEYNGVPVVAIAGDGFAEHTEIEELVLPESVTRIEEGAFANCTSLTGVTISAGEARTAQQFYAEGGTLEYIGDGAFENCTALADFSFEYGLEYVGAKAFAGTALSRVSLPSTVTYMGGEVFYDCAALTEIVVGDRDEVPSDWAENWNEGCDASVDFRLRIVLDYNGATSGPSAGEEYVSYGREFELSVPVRSGYSFDGWYSGDMRLTDGSGKSISAWQSQSGGILTAKWSANINTLTFVSNGGEGEMDSLSIATDDELTLPQNVFTRTGYTFVGWSTTPNGSAIYADQSQYTMGPSSSYRLYAVWRVNRYNIELNANGGTTEADNVQVSFGSQYTLPVPVLDGYKFLGWYDGTEETATAYTDDGGDSLAAWLFTENKTLYAHWQRVRFTITLNYECADGNADTEFIYVWTGNEYSLPVPSRENCEFGGWYSEADGNGTLIADEQGNGLGVWSGESNIVAYALWYEYTEGLMYELNDDDGYTLTGLSDKSVDEVFIPSYYNGRPVTRIAETALQNCINMRSLTVPSTVTEIAGGALYDCGSLEELTLPFIGASREAEGEQALLGYLFGQTEYENSISVSQYCSSGEFVDFYLPESLVNVRVTDTTNIGFGAFYSCNNLTSITLPENLTSIGDSAFAYCGNLRSIAIPEGVTSIGYGAFEGCTKLIIYCEVANQPSGWDSWWNGTCPVVWDCNNNSIDSDGYMYTIFNGLRYRLRDGEATVIGQSQDISGEVVIPSNVTYMGQSYNVTGIGDYAFTDCNSLTDITIPEGVTEIGEAAFDNCNNLTSAILPASLTSIGYYTFSYCYNLTSITIPVGVTSVESYAFYRCSNLTIYCEAKSRPNGWHTWFNVSSCPIVWDCLNNSIANDGYMYAVIDGMRYRIIDGEANIISQPTSVRGDIVIPSKILYNGDVYAVTIAANAFYNRNDITSVVINEGLTSISDSAFYGCNNLVSITIPASITEIAYDAFNGCNNLEAIYITDIAAWCSIRFASYSPEPQSNPLYYAGNLYLNGNLLTELVIPSGVTSIVDYAFYGCNSITNIIISEGVVGIGDYAFSGCSNLQSITIPESVTSIGWYVFNGCDNLEAVYISDISAWLAIDFGNEFSNPLYYAGNLYLNGNLVTELVIPEGVVSVGDYTFYGCSSLNSITIPASLKNIEEDVFRGCNNLNAVYINDITAWCTINFSNSLSNPLYYAERLYLNGDLLTELVIPEGVTSIGDYTFFNCESITMVVIPEGVTEIGRLAFSYCDSLMSITIPTSLTRMGYEAFIDCIKLEAVYISDIAAWCAIDFNGSFSNPLFYAENLYFNGDLVTELVIPEGVTSIGSEAFGNYSSLESIIIPESVTSVGTAAFSGCTGLTSIVIPESVTSVGDYAFRGCSNITIYCEAKSQPDVWDSNWNPDDCPVVWGYEVQ